MRLVTIDAREVGGRPGIWLSSDEIVDLRASPGGLSATQRLPLSTVSLLAEGEGGLERLRRLCAELEACAPAERERLRERGILLPASRTALLNPLRRAGLVLTLAADQAPAAATIKSPNTVVGPDARVRLPAWAEDQIAARAMLGAVIGRPLYAAGAGDAARAIAAWTLLLDLGGGDGQFPGACPLGPALATLDDHPDPGELSATINGHNIGKAVLAPWHARLGPLIAECSRRFALRPGDVVAPATDLPGLRLCPGDRVAVTLAGVMTLAATIA